MAYVTLDHVVSFANTLVKDADSISRNVWKDWIYTGAMLELGISDDEMDVAELTPKELLVPLPKNCRSIVELACYDSNGELLSHKFRTGIRRIFTDRRLIDTATTNAEDINSSVPVDVSNDDTNIVLGTNGSSVATILLRYFKYPLDENGNPLIREEDVMACAYFIKFMQAMRDNSNRSEIEQYKQMWYMAADRAKARKKMASMTPEKAKTVLKDMLRLIPQYDQSQF